jgi:hypothetical protein
MSWREAFLTHVGGGTFSGITLGRWLRVLRENHFAVDPPYWGRALAITLSSIPNSFHAWREERLFGERVRDTTVQPPLFILGIWRSGTTHLHNLLAQDQRFAYPNNYQVCFPNTFLTTEDRNAALVQFFLTETRPQDNMKIGVREPQEDEFAFCSLTGRGFVLAWTFFRRAAHYDRFLTLRDVAPGELAEWKAALTHFVQKLSFEYGKPLVLKSPGHTCRIKVLLELFPEARFVHIHRNPYDVYRSCVHTFRKVAPWTALQRPRFDDLEEHTLRQYREVYDAFFEERGLIPSARFHEVGFEDLEADPIGQMRAIYDALGLPDFTAAEPGINRYLQSVSGYKKNSLADLPPMLRSRISRHWRRCFDEWGYPS